MRFDVPPEEAIDYFQRKKVLPKTEFNKLEREAKAAAFTVGQVYKQEILDAFKFEITSALESGQTKQYVVKQFKDILDGAGHKELGDFHLETIARSNLMSAYGCGKRKQMEEVADLLPFWQLFAVGDDRTRPKHQALSGSVYPADHEFWDTHYAPYDFNCRCNVVALPSYPPDYDHRKPNEDTTIAYDEKGLPAKAEYLNQVVDLKATKFAGVPKTANLEKALIDAAKEAQATKQRTRDTYKTPQSVIEKAKEIRNEKVEVVHLFDAKGNHLLSGRGTNDEFEIDIPDNLVPKFMGGIDVHNHPPEAGRDFESFSLDDITNAADWELIETTIVTKNYFYSMRPPKTGWNESWKRKITEAFWKINDEVMKDFYERFSSGELTLGQIKDAVRHKVWILVAKELGLRYKRKRF